MSPQVFDCFDSIRILHEIKSQFMVLRSKVWTPGIRLHYTTYLHVQQAKFLPKRSVTKIAF